MIERAFPYVVEMVRVFATPGGTFPDSFGREKAPLRFRCREIILPTIPHETLTVDVILISTLVSGYIIPQLVVLYDG